MLPQDLETVTMVTKRNTYSREANVRDEVEMCTKVVIF